MSQNNPLLRKALLKSYVPEVLKEGVQEWTKKDFGRSESTAVMEALKAWLPKQGIQLDAFGPMNVSSDDKPRTSNKVRARKRHQDPAGYGQQLLTA